MKLGATGVKSVKHSDAFYRMPNSEETEKKDEQSVVWTPIETEG